MSDTADTMQAPQATSGNSEKPNKKDDRAGAFWWWTGAGVLAFALLAGGAVYYGGYLSKSHAAKQKVENAFFFRIDGKDKSSRAATFDFIILTDEYTWVKGSTTQVVSRGEIVPDTEVAEKVLTPRIRESLASATDLIAVGLASQEGERAQEEQRALSRSQTVQGWMNKLSNPGVALWTLTLGQYDKACKKQEDADSSFERPLIFAGVRSKAEGTNLQEALADAISGHDNLPSRECYSRFDMAKVR